MTAGTVSLMGFAGAGLFGTETLATLRFAAGGPAGSSTALDLAVDSFADPLGQETSPGVEDGRISVQGGAPTPAPDGEREVAWGDVDCDGDVDAVDALKILRKVANLSVSQEPDCPPMGSTVTVSG